MRRSRNALLGALAALGLLLAGPARGVAQTTAPANPHGALPADLDCSACHTASGWTSLRSPLAFDHSKMTDFPLDGRHAEAPCAGCHLNLRFDAPRAAATECSSCHLDVHQGSLDGGCASCHNTTSFQEAAGLDRHARTTFPLTGAHVRVACEQCHAQDQGGVFSPLAAECLSCHRADYSRGHQDPGGGTFDTQCQRCHQTSGWKGVQFDHAALSNGFALQGRHQLAPCESCHTQGGGVRFQASGADDCVACHQSDYDNEHRQSGFPTTCLQCHTADGWERGPFDHAAAAHGYELVGMHSVAPCSSCHMDGNTSLRFHPSDAQDCVSCHRPDYDQNHAADGFPLECGSCHTADGWARAPFDHAAVGKGFSLQGAHLQTACTSCHVPPDFAPRFTASGNNDCVACHQVDYDREHTGTGFPTTCSDCHSVNDWDHAVFDHLALTGFALTDAHAQAPCASCHSPADNSLLFPKPAGPQDCVSCHQVDYDANHTGTGFTTNCTSCHSTGSWQGANFDHAATTGFQLAGAHASADCATCHNPSDNSLLFPQPSSGQDCVACHQADYDAKHGGTSFPTTCTSCHTESQWKGAIFDHSITGFTLQGAHRGAPCASCHEPTTNALLFPQPANDQDCVTCHQADYDANHNGTNFPTTCTSCHTTTQWKGATFDHAGAAGFALVGAHATAPCSSCHNPSDNALLFPQPANSNDCVACHQTDYDANHTGSGFPLTCTSCHNANQWTGATFNHTWFPIYSGKHANRWNTCDQCHITPGDYTVFTCMSSGCHSKSRMDSEHQGRSGYAYDPVKCLACHPTGRG